MSDDIGNDHLYSAAVQTRINAESAGLWGVVLRPKLYIDGDQWCALYGENIQDGVAGFGESPNKAMWAFHKAMMTDLPATREQDAEGNATGTPSPPSGEDIKTNPDSNPTLSTKEVGR